MDVLFLSPAYPLEMQQFSRGLAEVGARVFGVGDSDPRGMPSPLKSYLADYLQVPSILDEEDVFRRVMSWGRRFDRIEANWEPVTLLAARLREAMGIPGMSVDTVVGFRDKVVMRDRVAAAGLRIPRTVRVASREQAWKASEEVGFPLILKPVDGAGSADTWKVSSKEDLDGILARLGHRAEASCEEFIEGTEYTYETICVNGRPAYESVCVYAPNALDARKNEWISPIIQSIRDLDDPRVRDGIALGRSVLSALGMGTGFTHMEWFRTPKGEAVFGEIACRAPGACMVDLMNYTGDIDLFREWARAVCWGDVRAPARRPYSAAIVFKRAQGNGRISDIRGLQAFRQRFGGQIAREDWLPIGSPRRDWHQTFLSDGHVVVRHPDERVTRQIAEIAAAELCVLAHG